MEEQAVVSAQQPLSRYADALVNHLNDVNVCLAYLVEVLLAQDQSEHADAARRLYTVNWHLARAVEKGKWPAVAFCLFVLFLSCSK